MTHTSPLDLQQHVVIVWGGDDDRPEVDEIYGPFPDHASAAAVADRTNAYIGHRITLDVMRLVPPKAEDVPVCGQDYMAGQICALRPGHDGTHS